MKVFTKIDLRSAFSKWMNAVEWNKRFMKDTRVQNEWKNKWENMRKIMNDLIGGGRDDWFKVMGCNVDDSILLK